MSAFKRKEKFDKASKLGLFFSTVSFVAICYELLTHTPIRLWLIVGYVLVLASGGLYIFFLHDPE